MSEANTEEKKCDKENVENKKNEIYEQDVIDEENVISICLRNILKSVFEKDSEHFWSEKNKELKEFAENSIRLKESQSKNLVNNSPHIDEDIILNKGNRNSDESVNAIGEENKSVSRLSLELEEKGKEKKRKSRKRNYINIEKIHFDFNDDDLVPNEDDQLINVNYFKEQGEYASQFPNWNNINDNNNYYNIDWDDWINMGDENVKKILSPPKIPFNEKFRKLNKEISEFYIKTLKESKTENIENIILNAQLKSLEPIESIEREHSSISEQFDKLIMEKLEVIQPDNINNNSTSDKKNRNLSKMLEYLMSWYFAGYYLGKMSA